MKKSDVVKRSSDEIIAWMESDEGQKKLQEAIELSIEQGKAIEKAFQVDFRTLCIPVGPVDGTGDWLKEY